MFYALSWFAVLGLIALWSLAAWAFHSMAAWMLAHAGGLGGGSVATEALGLPDWLSSWMPPELAAAFTSMVSALAPVVQTLLDWAPSLAGGLSVLVWVVWALGSALLVALGLLLSGLIAVLRARSSGGTGPSMSAGTPG